jgi:hypothetical protein
MAHLLEYLFALFVATYKKLHSSLRFAVNSLNMEVTIKRVDRFDLVVAKHTHYPLYYR